MKLLLALSLILVLTTSAAFAQSLKPENPAPLQAGINKGTVDNMVGTHYWYVNGLTGKTHIHGQVKSLGLLGNPQRVDVTFTLSDAKRTWHTTKTLSSDSKFVDCNFDGDLKAPTRLIITVAPPPNGLIHLSADYQLEASGAVAFGEKSTTDPIIGTYTQMNGYTTNFGASKFRPDGSIETASGAAGTWKLFDESSRMYVIDMQGQERRSLQLVPGRGICDGDSIIFQSLK